MISATFFRRASVVLAAFTVACGDSTGPNANLSEAEVSDMLDAMSAVASFGSDPQASSGGSGASLQMSNLTVNVSQTVSCPSGGSTSVSGTATYDEAAGTMTTQVTQTFSSCAATSSEGRVWTFNGNPSIVTNVSASYNETTGAFSMTATQVGGIRFSSNVGSGSCQINLTLTISGDQDSFAGTLSGSACGHDIEQSIEVTA